MIIEKSEIQQEDYNITIKQFLPNIVKHIMSICQVDKNFQNFSELKDMNKKLTILTEEVEKKNKVLTKSMKIEKKLIQEIEKIEIENNKIKYRICDKLNIEIEE